jgi:general secretion pathway protein D
VTSPQDLQEVITTLRQVLEVNKLFNYGSQNAVIVKAAPAKMALVEKIISDLDKPRSEVLVDVTVMEVSTQKSQQLAAAFAAGGINMPISFTPRTSLQTLPGQLGTTTSTTSSTGFTNNGSTTTTTSTTGTTTATTGTTTATTGTTSTTTSAPIPLVNLQHITTQDFSLTNVPGGLLEAILTDSATRVLQRPQIRAVANQKAVLKIGEKIPTASGSFQAGTAVTVSPLVNTQFTYIDTGVNLEITPQIHDNGEVSLHVDIDISQVDSYNDLGGIEQPVIGQQKFTADVRMKDGQINLIGGLTQLTDSKTISGIPGLSSIPILKNLFNTNHSQLNKTELLISLVPHIVRGPDYSASNLQEVYAGNQTNYAVRYAQALPVATLPVETTPKDGPGLAPSTVVPPATTVPATPPVSPGLTPGLNPGVTPGAPPRPPLGIPAPPARVSFSPAKIEAQQGSQFTVVIRAEGAANLQSIESQIKFDPKILRVNSITAGDLLQQNALALTPQKNILNDSGEATATLARDPAKGSVSGSGGLLVVTFQAFAKGQTLVTLPRTVLHDATGVGATAGSAPLSVTVK